VGPDVWLEVVAKGCAQITFLKCSKVMEEGKAIMRQALPDCEIKESR
jgi:hypothetical protein